MQYIVPCNDMTEDGAFEKSFSTFNVEDRRMTRFRPICIRDVEVALDETGNTTTAEDIKAFDDWYNDFGTGIKKKPNQPQSLRGNEKADLDLRDSLRGYRGHAPADLARFIGRFLFESLLG